jgi:hypothetical protein
MTPGRRLATAPPWRLEIPLGRCLPRHGREPATVALAIVSSKEAEYFRTSPGGSFHGMVAKGKAGELHLERTGVGPCAGPQSRKNTRAGQGGPIAVKVPGHGEDCHHARPFVAAGSGASICGLPTVHSSALGVRPRPPSKDRAGGIPDFRPRAACQAGRYPSAVTPLRRQSLGPYPVAIEAPFRGFSNERRKS